MGGVQSKNVGLGSDGHCLGSSRQHTVERIPRRKGADAVLRQLQRIPCGFVPKASSVLAVAPTPASGVPPRIPSSVVQAPQTPPDNARYHKRPPGSKPKTYRSEPYTVAAGELPKTPLRVVQAPHVFEVPRPHPVPQQPTRINAEQVHVAAVADKLELAGDDAVQRGEAGPASRRSGAD